MGIFFQKSNRFTEELYSLFPIFAESHAIKHQRGVQHDVNKLICHSNNEAQIITPIIVMSSFAIMQMQNPS